MRFNKSKSWTLFGHSSPKREAAVPVVSTSTEAPESDPGVSEETAAPQPAETKPATSRISADPIHDLSTAVNKFQRLLSQAQYTPEGAEWVEKCMNELATGLEIAIDCDLIPMRDALIDTARILHSYDRAGRWQESLPFLNNSYNILSLMVGDLIIDKIQPALVRKWKVFYQKASEELGKAGIPLADDEEEQDAPLEQPGDEETGDVDNRREEDLDSVVETTPEPTRLDAPETQTEDTVPPEETADVQEQADLTDDTLAIPPLSKSSLDDTFPEESVVSDSIIKFPNSGSGTATRSRNNRDEEDIFDNEAEEEEEEEEEAFAPDEPGTNDSFQEVTQEEEDLLFDDMATYADEEDIEPDLEEDESDSPEESDSDETYESEETDFAEDREAEVSTEEEPANEHITESLFKDEDMDTGVADSQVSAPARTDKPAEAESPEHLLHRAREAMEKGAVQDAKSAALGLALAMARIEYDQAVTAASEAEQRLVDNAQSIRAAQDTVETAERNLLQTEELLATREGECDACREHIATLDNELVQFQTDLEEIDAQIAALQQKRAEQVHRIDNKHIEKEDVLHNESRLQTEIESLKQEADGMRQDLEALRLDKKMKIDNKQTIEVDICSARETAEERRMALDAIRRTLNPETEQALETYPENGDLL